MTSPAATPDLSALPTLSPELSELNESQLNEFASAAEALVVQVTDVRILQD
ncbi:phenylalanine--tRNA ligase subunit alpha, partial [Psychrobacter sp. T6-1]